MAHKRYISEHFTASENACNCGECSGATADVETVRDLEEMRAELGGNRVVVHSWFRCRAHNNRPANERNSRGHLGAGSNDNSWHLLGGAVDFHILGVSIDAIGRYLREKYPDSHGVGLYDTFVHLDPRPIRGDWDYRRDTVIS